MIMQDKELFTYLPSDNPKVPAAEFPFRHHQPVQMRFTDIDMLGHLNNNVYLTFMDLAKVEYFAAVLPEGMDWRSMLLPISMRVLRSGQQLPLSAPTASRWSSV